MAEVPGRPGQILADRYRLLSLLGRGGMGCVWRAEHGSLGTPVAVKLIFPEVATRPGTVSRFLREAKAAAMLRSVNVVQILDHGVHEGTPYIAMECLDGESLAERLRRVGKLDAAGTALVMTGVCRALARARRMGIVHRDLKPDNIFIASDEAGPIVKVLDFGIAKIIHASTADPSADTATANRTETGAMLGTPRYMSPEQARGQATVDGRSDLWSLAVIACECLTGKPPFDATVLGDLIMQICSDPIPAPSAAAGVPPGFDAWFARATKRDPAERLQSAREFADALGEILTPGQRWLETAGDGDLSARVAARTQDEHVAETGAPSVKERAHASPARSSGRIAVAAGLAVAVAGVALALSRSPSAGPGAAPAASPVAASAPLPASAPAAPSIAPSAAPSASARAPANEEMMRVLLVVVPSDASVEADGAPVRSRDGVVEIVGKLGSVHRVRVFKGKTEVEGDVSITSSGAMPPKMDLAAAKPKGGPAPVRARSFDD